MISLRSLAPVVAVTILCSATSLTHAATLNVPASFKSIQNAVDSARSGDTIRVTGGTYNESVVINRRRISIRGRRNATLNGSFDVQANRVSISGFNIVNIGDDGGFGIRLAGNRGNASNNDIDILNPDDDDGFGILVTGDINTVEGNDVQGGSTNIEVRSGSDRNRIIDNVVRFGFDVGIDISGDDSLIEDNQAVRTGGNEGVGIDINGTNHRVIDNLSADNQNGYSISGSGHVIQGNDAEDNDDLGFGGFPSDTIFDDLNQSVDNRIGFDIRGSNNRFNNNEADDNEDAGWVISGSDSVFINNGADNNDIGMRFDVTRSPTGNVFRFNECKDNNVAAIPSNLCEDTTR